MPLRVAFSLRAPATLWDGVSSWLRLGLIFAATKLLMISAGWAIGTTITAVGPAIDHWIAFTLLGILGIFTIAQSFMRRPPEEQPQRDSTEALAFQAAIISMDALIAGLR